MQDEFPVGSRRFAPADDGYIGAPASYPSPLPPVPNPYQPEPQWQQLSSQWQPAPLTPPPARQSNPESQWQQPEPRWRPPEPPAPMRQQPSQWNQPEPQWSPPEPSWSPREPSWDLREPQWSQPEPQWRSPEPPQQPAWGQPPQSPEPAWQSGYSSPARQQSQWSQPEPPQWSPPEPQWSQPQWRQEEPSWSQPEPQWSQPESQRSQWRQEEPSWSQPEPQQPLWRQPSQSPGPAWQADLSSPAWQQSQWSQPEPQQQLWTQPEPQQQLWRQDEPALQQQTPWPESELPQQPLWRQPPPPPEQAWQSEYSSASRQENPWQQPESQQWQFEQSASRRSSDWQQFEPEYQSVSYDEPLFYDDGAQDPLPSGLTGQIQLVDDADDQPSRTLRHKVKFHLSRRMWIIIGCSVVALALIIGIGVVWGQHSGLFGPGGDRVINGLDSGSPSMPPLPDPAPIWPLTGMPMSANSTSGPALCIKIENSVDARPQLGLDSADIVFEEVVEGGITRFMAVFQSTFPAKVEPVRSLRPMDPPLAKPFGCALVFSGGQRAFLTAAQKSGVKLIYQDRGDSGFSRDPKRGAPHNVLGDTKSFLSQAASAKLSAPSSMFSYPELGQTTSIVSGGKWAKKLDLKMSYSSDPHWTWNSNAGLWYRYEYDKPAMLQNKKQITAVNIVALSVTLYNTPYKDPAGTPVPETKIVGSGTGVLASAGRTMPIKWSKASDGEQITLTDASGNPVTLMPGNTWVELVPTTGTIKVS